MGRHDRAGDFVTLLALLPVTDLRRSAEWFTRAVGQPADEHFDGVAADWYLSSGQSVQLVVDPARAGGGICTVRVDDLPSAVRRLDDHGVRVEDHFSGSAWVRGVVLRDPDGNTLALTQLRGQGSRG
ncbi:VOC family protein [Actinokineospora bangkokensis]|uniref:VOC domain-containing protein n=1 Tax=Actinokineospora bangkokensis TaxID=1193682 RepID=A0A1Q9LNY1_9PSEU|nr:VOC family protein [Actinokineospora bangkokensis]OLR93709.1 hypothetical protein BJP25_15750 [Actinokineospora bangkokensis]